MDAHSTLVDLLGKDVAHMVEIYGLNTKTVKEAQDSCWDERLRGDPLLYLEMYAMIKEETKRGFYGSYIWHQTIQILMQR